MVDDHADDPPDCVSLSSLLPLAAALCETKYCLCCTGLSFCCDAKDNSVSSERETDREREQSSEVTLLKQVEQCCEE